VDGVTSMTEMTATKSPDTTARTWGSRLVAVLPLIVLVVLLAAVTMRQPSFLDIRSLQSLSISLAPILLLGIGQTFVVLTGGIDLSNAALTSLGTVLLAMWLPHFGFGAAVLMIVSLTFLGFLSGWVSATAQIPTFIVTLGAMGLWGGVGMVLTGASTVQIGDSYKAIAWVRDTLILQVPMPAVISVCLVFLVAALMSTLSSGRKFHAIGLAEQAVLMSGGSTFRLRCAAFALSGLFAGLAALVLTASQFSGAPHLADSLLLPVIAAIVVGGTAITGGSGGPIRTLVGASIVVVLRVGMNAVGVDTAYEQIVYGAVIILAVAVTIDRARIRVVK
jgi:ribose transport system permease protein